MGSSEESTPQEDESRHETCSESQEKAHEREGEETEAVRDAIAEIVDVKEEEDSLIQEAANEAHTPFLCFIASYAGMRISPAEEVYPTIGLADEFAIETAIDVINQSVGDPKELYLLVNSTGGSMTSSYKVARALGKSFNRIITFVPHVAASGGTLIALTGNDIVMGLMSHLSPLDPQTNYKKTIVSSTTYLKAFARTFGWFAKKRPEEVPYPQKALTDELDPLIMEEFASMTELAEEYVADILQLTGEAEEKARETAIQLVGGFIAHGQVLHADKLKSLRLPIKSADAKKYEKTWQVMKHWLGKYMLKEVPTTIIRYAIPAKRKPSSRKKGQ